MSYAAKVKVGYRRLLTSYRPEKDVHDLFPEEAAFKQVKLRLLVNELKRPRHP